MDIWNPWHGCRKYSEGCDNCYMFFLDAKHGKDGGEIYRVKSNFDLPIKKDRSGNYKIPSDSLLYVCLTSDFFLEDADEWRGEVWDMIRRRSDVHFRLQTKRAARVAGCLPDDWGDGWDNVTICFTAENQLRADERLPILLSLPCKHRAVMCAPILGAVELDRYLAGGGISEVLADGENYAGFRPCRHEWIVALRDCCAYYGVKFRFVGTGGCFIKDGKTYRICKAYQSVQAGRAGLNFPPTPSDIPVQPRCASCRRKEECNGCSWCGKC